MATVCDRDIEPDDAHVNLVKMSDPTVGCALLRRRVMSCARSEDKSSFQSMVIESIVEKWVKSADGDVIVQSSTTIGFWYRGCVVV